MPKTNSKLSFLKTSNNPIIGTTQSQIPVVDLVENIVLYKDGGAALVLESTSLNFGLLSEREQEAVVAAYAALINSLSFHCQILVRTQKKDVSVYIQKLADRIPTINNSKLQKLMIGYKDFISETIKKKNVLGKRFFIIIPFSPFELGISTKTFKPMGFLRKEKEDQALPFTKEYIIKKALVTLNPKRDHLIRQAQRLGLKLRQLTNQELLQLYYDIYNPDTKKFQIRKEDILDEVQPEEAGSAGQPASASVADTTPVNPTGSADANPTEHPVYQDAIS